MTSADMRRILHLAASSAVLGAAVAGASLMAQAPEPARRVKYGQINPEEMKAWLGYLASAGFSIADSERVLVRDNKGARTGFGSKAEVLGRWE